MNNLKTLPNTADKLSKAKDYLQKLSNDLMTNDSRRDEEIAASLFYLSSIIFKMTQACNKNDIDTEQRIAKAVYELYQNYIKELA